MSNNETEFRAILELQQELDGKLDEFISRVKALKTRLGDGHLIADLDGEIYELRKVSLDTQTIDSCRKHRGFYHDYRLVLLGKPLK